MTAEIVLTVPARHLTAGDHFNGMVISQIQRVPGIDGKTIHHLEFRLVVPYTTHHMDVTIREEDLDAVSFPLTKRGDDYNPNPRNAALGLPPVPPKPYVAPEPVAVYKAGTKVGDVRHFDRGQHIHFRCPLHPEARYSSKDPYVSNWFSSPDVDRHLCSAATGDYILTADYLPTRNG